MSTALIFERGGAMTTIQDRGRLTARAQGVPVSGALDPIALRLANALVGNPGDAPAFEIRLTGPRLRITGGAARLALVGTETPIEVLGPAPRRVPAGIGAIFAEGEVLSIGAVTDTACCILAVAGSVDLPAQLGSLSTYAPARLGGLDGRSLRDGDVVPLGLAGPAPEGELHLPRPWDYGLSRPIRVVAGPQAHEFSDTAIARLLGDRYTLSAQANRMGLRLDGPGLEHLKGHNIASDGVLPGAIQVPGDGKPIILLADCQTTGGYPKIATVISADLPRLGRLLPGQEIGFEEVSVEDAIAIRRRQESDIQAAIGSVRPAVITGAELTRHLWSQNIVGGVFGPDDPEASGRT